MRDFIELNRHRGLSPRQQRLLHLESVYEGTQYAGLAPWRPSVGMVNGVMQPIPCEAREPIILGGLAREKVDKLMDRLVGEGRLPSIVGLSDAMNKIVTEDIDLVEALYLPILDLVVKGAGCLGFARLGASRYEPIYLDPTWCEPIMVSQVRGTRAFQIAAELRDLGVSLPAPARGDALAYSPDAWLDDLAFLRHEWVEEQEVASSPGGQPGTTEIWRFRRDYLPHVIVEYEHVRILSGDTAIPKWRLSERPRPHNWGTVPLVWVRNRGARPKDADGPSFLTPFLLSLDKATDRVESMKDDAVVDTCWPQLTEIDVRDQVAELNMANGITDVMSSSSSEVRRYRSQGSSPHVGYLEVSGAGVEAARKHLEDIDKRAERVTGIVDVDAEGGVLSGTALERRLEPTVAKVMAYRSRVGELLTVFVTKIGLVAGEDVSAMELQWPRVIQPTPEEIAQTATSLSTAAGGVPVLSQETAVEMFATTAGLASPEDEMKRLQASADQTLDRLRASMKASDGAEKAPDKGEAPEPDAEA